MRYLALTFVWSLLFGLTPIAGADLSQIERRITQEPAYQSDSPRYGLLVFGLKAETRVWLVLDLNSEPWENEPKKNILYVDRDGDGDLTDPDERITATMQEVQTFLSFSPEPAVTYSPRFVIGDLVEQDGTRHQDLTVEVDSYVQDYRPCQVSVHIANLGKQVAGGSLLRLGDRPEEAPIIHFNGPLSINLNMTTGRLWVPISYAEDPAKRRAWYAEHPPEYEPVPLVPGETCQIKAVIGTPGLGRGTFASVVATAPPPEVHPVVEIEFPAAEPNGDPVKTQFTLQERCCGSLFCETIAVPKGIALGTAKVRVSFPDWKLVPIAATSETIRLGTEADRSTDE